MATILGLITAKFDRTLVLTPKNSSYIPFVVKPLHLLPHAGSVPKSLKHKEISAVPVSSNTASATMICGGPSLTPLQRTFLWVLLSVFERFASCLEQLTLKSCLRYVPE